MDALGDATRRAVLERLRDGPRPVGEIARGLPVSRPAVSQHLRTLKAAGLVRDRQVGTRRLYEVDPKGLADLRNYIDGLWDQALANFKRLAEADQGGRRGWNRQRSRRSSSR
ncbi:MAG TPA: metalloregulator ArsR/SmtB family transcription factor [Actinomycetota bacterium]|nr:metalloregulator ArsR/SmtB family transcription factor [Actinomycetota bacterium]